MYIDEYQQHVASRLRLAIYASPYGSTWLASRVDDMHVEYSQAVRWDEAIKQDRIIGLCRIAHRAELVCALHGALPSEL